MLFTWIGGATFLLELGAFRILSDPVFSSSVEGASGEMAARLSPVADIELPAIDLLVLSCDRRDHFDPDALDRVPDISSVIFPEKYAESFSAIKASNRQSLGWFEQARIEKAGEVLNVTAVPAGISDNGYFFEHVVGEKKFTAYWTADARWTNEVRDLQRKHGYANLLIQHLGAEEGADGTVISPDGKDAMQFVYRMQPNAVVAIHHNTFSHYAETIEPFRDLIARTIYDSRLRVISEGESFEKR